VVKSEKRGKQEKDRRDRQKSVRIGGCQPLKKNGQTRYGKRGSKGDERGSLHPGKKWKGSEKKKT